MPKPPRSYNIFRSRSFEDPLCNWYAKEMTISGTKIFCAGHNSTAVYIVNDIGRLHKHKELIMLYETNAYSGPIP